jgi:SNF2 family DNA or RNA helicase
MILSPKAGGVGLTLTAANHVIHLSRWWNPAVEDQSTDRVYRIGQRKAVHVHYLQATLPSQPGQSFDERLHVLLEKKRGLSRELLWPFENEAGDAATLLGRSP